MKDKEQTMRELIDAVGHIFITEGYTGLGVNKVARIAGRDKRLIYRYFGSFERLIEAYVMETDYWMRFADGLDQLTVPESLEDLKRLLGNLLKNQFLYFYEDKGMQQLILWELAGKSKLMTSIHQTREMMGQRFIELTENLTGAKINYRAIAALMVGGIYYMILHTRNNGHIFSDIDLSKSAEREEILHAIDMILELSFG